MTRILFVLICIIASLESCGCLYMEPSADLAVVEQIDSVFGNHVENNYCYASFDIDVPINGPQVLVDSVMTLVNREVYKMCEYCVEFVDSPDEYVVYNEKEMFTNDGKRLLDHYMDKYKSLIEDSLWNTFGLKLKMVAQTEKYVTYGAECFYCGANCSSEKHFYTFDKSDGHQVKGIISGDNLVRFFSDYPEYNSIDDDPWFGRAGWQFSPEDDTNKYDYGLLDDHFSLVIQGCGNHFILLNFPYSQIFSYLSQEAQALVKRNKKNESMLPSYLSHKNPEVYLEVDTINYALIGCVSAAGGEIRDTLLHYDPALKIYPKQVYSIDASLGSPLYLLIYSFGHLLYCDEAMTCIYTDDYHLQPISLFLVDGQRDSVVTCMWYDQLVEASDGFPFDEFDENRFGLHYDWFTKRLYYPILDSHDSDSEFVNTSCLRYTGRFEVLHFNGKEFVLVDNDGAWWLNSDLRKYKRTIRNRINDDGIEQIDLMPDSTYRRAVWKNAKTLDDLRRNPNEIKMVSKEAIAL